MKRFAKYKPGISVRTHLLIAALIWSLVGVLLLVRGYIWVAATGRQWLLLPAVVLGTLKSLLVLDRVARKNIVRINGFKNVTCIGAVYSYKTWGLIALMIVMGRLARLSAAPKVFVGILYMAIGWALFLASRLIWREQRVFNAANLKNP